MQGPADETVGETFLVDLLTKARDQTLAVILAAASVMRAGMTEADAKSLIQEIQNRMGAPKNWHPPQIRFGENTTLGFGEPGRDGVTLQPDDIFFFDLGPIFAGHEGDVGRTFVIGHDAEFQRCSQDAEKIWHEVRAHWEESGSSGVALYAFAEQRALVRGWALSRKKANGHRVADFPHAAKGRGSIEGFEECPAPDRWILEIQIRHPEKSFGAFYEDLLR